MHLIPELEREPSGDDQAGWGYALLFHRTQLRLGRKQRYGSQRVGDKDSRVVAPLEDPEHVDTRRAALGLGPLGDKNPTCREFYCATGVPVTWQSQGRRCRRQSSGSSMNSNHAPSVARTAKARTVP